MHMNKKSRIPQEVTETILESISDGVFTVDLHWRITSFNSSAEKITGIPREEAIGRFCWEVFRANMCEGDCALRRTMEEEKPFVSSSTYIINSEKKRIPIAVSTSLLVNDKDEILGGVETFRDYSLVEELRQKLNSSYQLGNMVSRSKEMQKLFKILDQVALSDSTVLIEGETGTGKELMAKAIHSLSARKNEPFIAVNCGALPDNLLESELFGYKAGAFTDARSDKPGMFDAAAGGTILLDEIGDTSSAFQVRLLRVLEEKEFQPLGSTEKVKTNTRVIAATNRNLEAMVKDSTFRKDLFYRINIVSLKLPPLRKRTEDIPLLVERFISKMNTIKGKAISGVSTEAMRILLAHDYPGNIRELENIIEHGFILCSNGQIDVDHLPVTLQQPLEVPAEETRQDHPPLLETAQRDAIIAALRLTGYNRSGAAELLGMHKSTLFRKIKKFKIHLPDKDGRHR